MRLLGIDPGLIGGAAILITGDDLDGPPRIFDAIDIPTHGLAAKKRVDVLELARWIKAGAPDIAFIERAQSYPSQGSSSGFIYGRACGALEAATILAHVPLNFVEARTWKGHFGLVGAASYARAHGVPINQAHSIIKNHSRQAVLRVFPGAMKYLMHARDHGKAEAILLAMFGADQIASEVAAA